MKKIFTFLSLLLTISILSAQNPFSGMQTKNNTTKQWTSSDFQHANRDMAYTTVTLPLDTTFLFSAENSIDLTELFEYPVRGVIFKFTLTEATILTMEEENWAFNTAIFKEQIDGEYFYTSGYVITQNFTPGDYYVVLPDPYEEIIGTTVHFSINIFDVNFKEISIPYEGEIAFTTESPTYNGLYAAFYTFTTTETMDLAFYSQSGKLSLGVFSEEFEPIYVGGNITLNQHAAGTYRLLVVNGNNPVPNSDILYITNLVNYWDLDYSQVIPAGEKVIGSPEDLVSGVDIDEVAFSVASYSIQVTEGRTYKVSFDVFSRQNGIEMEFYVFHENLTQNIYEDYVYSDFDVSNSSILSSVMSFTANTSEKVNFAFASVSQNVYYIIKIDEIITTTESPNPGSFAFAEMTLPFSKIINFDPAQFNNVLVVEEYGYTDVYKAYHLNITEAINLLYIKGFYSVGSSYYGVPMLIYNDATLSSSVTPYGLWNGDKVILAPGDYYILFADNGVFQSTSTYMVPTIYVDFEPATLIETSSLYELLTDPNIETVAYANMPYSASGYFTTGFSDIVAGEDGDNFSFRNEGENFFAKAIKVTGISANDLLKIHVAHSEDAYMYIYKIDGGDIYQVCYNDDGQPETPVFTNGYESYLEETLTDAGDYYIVATTYDSYSNVNNSIWAVTMWTDNNEPAVSGSPAMPIIGEIARTTANVESLTFDGNVTSNSEIFIALMALNITATRTDEVTFAVINNPFVWVINANQSVATFSNINIPNYTIAANYVPATINLLNVTSTNDLLTAKLSLYPNPAVDNIYIDGLQASSNISIISINGKILKTLSATSQNQSISVNDLASGTYIVTIQNGKNIEVLKFVK